MQFNINLHVLQAAATEAVNVKNANIRLIIISIGTDVNVPAFQQMASYPPTTSQLAVRYVANYTLLPPFVNGAMCRSQCFLSLYLG